MGQFRLGVLLLVVTNLYAHPVLAENFVATWLDAQMKNIPQNDTQKQESSNQQALALAQKLGSESSPEGLEAIIATHDIELFHAYERSFRETGMKLQAENEGQAQPLPAQIEAVIVKHYQEGDIGPLLRSLYSGTGYKYRSRALFDLMYAEWSVKPYTLVEQMEAASHSVKLRAAPYGMGGSIFNTDLTGIEEPMLALLQKMDGSQSVDIRAIIGFLAERKYYPSAPEFIDLIGRASPQQVGDLAAEAVKLGTPAILDAVVRRLVEMESLPRIPAYPSEPIEAINKRNAESFERTRWAIQYAPPWAKLNRDLLPEKVIQRFAPVQASQIVAMIKERDSVNKMADEITSDNFTYWISRKQNEMVRSFIKRGVDVNATNKSHERPLTVAINSVNLEAVSLLLKAGANPNYKSAIYNGWKELTPLHVAISRKAIITVKLLVEGGADVNAEVFDYEFRINGLTPTQLADELGDKKIATYLRSKGGVVNYSFVTNRALIRTKNAIVGTLMIPFFLIMGPMY